MHIRIRAVILLLLGTALWTSPASAQTWFEWPDTIVDLSRYTTIDQCHAAVGRVRVAVGVQDLRATGIWRDTIPYDPAEDSVRLPDEVSETARRCLERFATVDSVPLDYFKVLVPLYVIAGWDEKAQALVRRRIATIEPDDEDALVSVLDSVSRIYRGNPVDNSGVLRVQPRRPELALEIFQEYLPRISDRVNRFMVYREMWWMIDPGAGIVDSATAQEASERFFVFVDSLTAEDRQRLHEKISSSLDSESLERQIRALLRMRRGHEEFLDSLRHSTESYVRAQRQVWSDLFGQPPETFGFGMPIGTRAPAIEADLWFGCDGPCDPRPRPGKVSIVLFVDHGDCIGVIENDSDFRDTCVRNLATLRHLEERFPTLETTIVTRTRGYFQFLKDSITPEREAELIRRWIEHFRLRAAIAVTFPGHWRLPAPDRRRIDQESPNRINYSFGNTWGADSGIIFLIDQDGLIIYSHQLHRYRAVDYAKMIEVLLEREAATS